MFTMFTLHCNTKLLISFDFFSHFVIALSDISVDLTESCAHYFFRGIRIKWSDKRDTPPFSDLYLLNVLYTLYCFFPQSCSTLCCFVFFNKFPVKYIEVYGCNVTKCEKGYR